MPVIQCDPWVIHSLVRAVMVDGKVKLGNVEFWLDEDALCYSIPNSKWDGVGDALAHALLKKEG
jgi:hypothetical protein